MERAVNPDRHIKYQYSRRSRSGVVIQEPNAAANAPTINPPNTDAPAASVPNPNPPPGFKCDPDQYMPIANVVRIMRRILPPHAKIADDAKETIQECVSEFISFITSEANEKCHREYRKTVTPEDVLSALGSLGFDNYVETLTLYLNKYRASDPERAPIQNVPFVRLAPLNFVQRPMAQRPRPTPTPPVPAGYVPLPPAYATDEGGYSELPLMTDFFMGNNGGGEGTSRQMEEFDPFK